MEIFKKPFKGIKNEFSGRKACYKQDWVNALCSRDRILVPTTYIFFAPANDESLEVETHDGSEILDARSLVEEENIEVQDFKFL